MPTVAAHEYNKVPTNVLSQIPGRVTSIPVAKELPMPVGHDDGGFLAPWRQLTRAEYERFYGPILPSALVVFIVVAFIACYVFKGR